MEEIKDDIVPTKPDISSMTISVPAGAWFGLVGLLVGQLVLWPYFVGVIKGRNDSPRAEGSLLFALDFHHGG